MEWTLETGQHVTWEWSTTSTDDSGAPEDERYAIRIHVDGRRLRGTEANQMKHRIGAEFPVAES